MNKIVRLIILMNMFFYAFTTSNVALANDVDRVSDKFALAETGSVRLDGWLGEKLQLCLDNRVMAQDITRVIKPFRDRIEADYGGFRCEYWGKWFSSAALGYAYQPTDAHRAVIKEAVGQLLSTQSDDGYIGSYPLDKQLGGWDVWGRKYVLLGLIAYSDVSGDQKALDAACRAADYFMTQVGPGKANIADLGYPGWEGLPATSILEPFVLLYRRTGRSSYLEFAKWIVAQWDRPSALSDKGLRLVGQALVDTPPAKIGAPKAYEMMSCYEGLCELYRATGEDKYFKAALKMGKAIRQRERMVIGSGSNHELWCDGTRFQTETLEQPVETCVTATWSKLCCQLLRLTGDSAWADEMELSLYNALIGAMTPDGRWWAYYSPLRGERVASLYQHPEVGLSCCVASGPRALLLVPRWAIMRSKDGPVVNLYAPGEAIVKLEDGNEVTITQKTNYPEGELVNLTLTPKRPAHFALRLRIPAWSVKTELSVNGKAVKCQAGRYAVLEREWQKEDQVELRLDLRGRVIAAPSGAPEMAVMRGPVVLALDSRLVKAANTAVRLVVDDAGLVALKR